MSNQPPPQSFRLGSTGPDIGLLGIGTWAWGDRLYWGYGNQYTDADLRVAFEASINRGIRFFDTAEVYGLGRSERLLGEFDRAYGGQAIVGTKYFPFPVRFGRKAIANALRRSLRRLRMEQVDLYQIHWPSPLMPVEVMMDGLADAVEQGLARAVGVSNFGVGQMKRAHQALAKRGVPLASNQVDYSLIQRKPERSGLLQLCRELGVTLIAYSPLGMGLLTGKYTADNPPPGVRGRRFGRQLLVRVQALVGLMREIGQTHGGKPPAQVALNWAISKGTLPIPGAKNARQADENAGAVGWMLTDDEVATLDAASDRLAVTDQPPS